MGVRFGIVSTYTPTQCGIATFTAALTIHLQRLGAEVGIVRLVEEPMASPAPVVREWVVGKPGSADEVVRTLDGYDVAVVQHEYGIFGGADGADILGVVGQLRTPIVSVLHTVLAEPTSSQHRVLAELCAASSMLVTMTDAARSRLVALWGIHPSRICVIRHGAEDNRASAAHGLPMSGARPTVLTWGLLGEGKGIEWALRAFTALRDIRPVPQYHIVGRTHPRVLENDGEAYRDRLVRMTAELGLASLVRFDGTYLSGPALRRIVRDADVILLPYDSRDQATSGVLTEAVAAGKPVISTAFPHAVELLTSGAGLLVPQRDPDAIACALRRVLTETGLAETMAATSRELTTSLLWPAIAASYLRLARSLVATPSISVA